MGIKQRFETEEILFFNKKFIFTSRYFTDSITQWKHLPDVQQIFTKKVQFHYQMQLHLPDAQQNFAVIAPQRRTDRITNGKNILYLDVQRGEW